MVEIIPKKIPTPHWINYLFYLYLILLICSFVSYLFLNYALAKSQTSLQEIKDAIAKEETLEKVSLEREILTSQQKIQNFSKIIGQYLISSKIFGFFQENCHPKVYFKNFNLISGSGLAVVSGETDSFKSLGQQELIFANNSDIKEAVLSNVSMGKEGVISFSFSVYFKAGIFK